MQITKPIKLNRHIKLPKLPKNWGKMRDGSTFGLPIPFKAKPVKLYSTEIIRDKKGNIRKIIVNGGAKGQLLTLKLEKALYN